MDRGIHESIVRPWWLAPPAFLVVMILAAVVIVGYVGMCWYVDGLLLEWTRAVAG